MKKTFWINCKAYRVDVVLVLRIDANQFGNLVSGASIYLRILSLPGVLKTGLPEILSQVQHIAGNLSKHNLLN